jgi:hypothetical protein
MHGCHVSKFNTRSCVALKVETQTDNVMKPIGWQIQDISCLQYHFIAPCQSKFGILFQVRIGPIHSTVSCRRMPLGQQCQILALIWMRQNVSSLSPQNGNGIARSIKMIFGNDPLHTKAAVNVVLLFRSDNIQGWFGLKQKRGNSSKR